MKSLYLLMLVSLCQSQEVQQLPTTQIIWSDESPSRTGVSWLKVDSGDETNPVIGYKVKVWELKITNVTKLIAVNSKLKEIQVEEEEPYNESGPPSGVPIEETTYTTVATHDLPYLKLKVPYEIRVNAFTRKGDGPSAAFRVTEGAKD